MNSHQATIGKPSGLGPFHPFHFDGSEWHRLSADGWRHGRVRQTFEVDMIWTTRLLISLCAMLASVLTAAQPATAAAAEHTSRNFQTEADAIVDSAWPTDGPGLAVIVTKGGEIIYNNARGWADIEARKPATLDTVFRIGSMTKQFTAALVLKLAEDGKLSLDDPLTKFVPDYPAPGGDATVRQLLNHTSGIQSYNEIPGWFVEANTHRAFTTDELIAEFRDRPAQFEPGIDWAYNNSGYVLLAAVIEAVTGNPWQMALKERITGPLGLASIRHGGEQGGIAARAVPYSAGPNGVGPAPEIHPSVFSAAGALVGSVRDLARWSAALHHGKVLGATNYAQMIAPTLLPDGRTIDYGYGFFREKIQGIEAITHGGSAPGGATMGVYLPEQDVFVAAFANTDVPTTHPATIARRLAALAGGRPYPLLGEVTVDPASLKPLFGVYATAAGAVERQLYFGGGQIRLLADGREWPVYFAGDDRFIFNPDYLDWFEIKRNGSGTYVLEMHDAATGEVQQSFRTGPVPPRVVPRTTLERYLGRYNVNGTITIIRLGSANTLTVQLAGQPATTELRTISATQFAADAVGALLTFEGGGAKASTLRSRLDEVEVVGTRIPDEAEPDS